MRFVVEQTLAGEGDRLKGYTVAIEVFDRPADFDSQSDPLVRVEAGRLRRRLIEYYAEEGRADPVKIELPRGGYTVACSYQGRHAGPTEVPPGREAVRGRRFGRRLRAWVVLVAIAAAFAVIVQQRDVARLERDRPPPPASIARDDGKAPIVVRPFDDLSGDGDLRTFAATLTEEILLLLDQPEIFVVATAGNRAAGASGWAGEQAAYVLSGSVRDDGGQLRITARLVRADSGTQIWSAAYDEPLSARRSPVDQRRLARLIAAVADPYGPIFDIEVERVRGLPPDALRARDCELKYYDYRRVLTRERHGEALGCFERAAAREADNAEAWAGLALVTAEGFAQDYADPTDPAPLDRPREAARRAMDIDGASLHANLALTGVQYFGGGDFRDAAERMLRSWPENAEVQAFIGALFIFTGDTARGRALVERALEATPRAPSGYYATTALAALREQRFEAALASALKIDSPDWPLGLLIVAATGAAAGRPDLAARAKARLLELDPTFATSLPEVLRRWRMEPVLTEQIERAFAGAG